MKIIKKESIGIQEVYNTNVNTDMNYISSNGIINHNCLVDHGYSGEVHIDLHNIGFTKIKLEAGQKIIQALLLPVEVPSLIEVHEDDLYQEIALVSSRGEGGFGSTGK